MLMDKPDKKKILSRWLLIAAVALVSVIGLLLRLRAVDSLPIDYDEDDYLKAGQHYAALIRSGDWQAVSEYGYNLEHPPLAKLLYGISFLSLPVVDEVAQKPTSAPPASTLPEPHLTTGRTVSAVLGSLEVLFLSILNPVAGLFLAVHTFTIKYTSQLMLEGLPVLSSLLSVMAFSKSKGKLNSWLIISAILLGITAASKYLYAIIGIAVLVFWLTQKTPGGRREYLRKRLPLVILWGVIAILVFFLFDPFLWSDPITHLKDSLLFNVGYSQSSEVTQSGLAWWQPLAYLFMSVPWHPGVFLISLDALVTVLGLFGIKRQWQKDRLIVIWLIVALFFLFIWPTKWPQYLLIVSAPLCVCAAQGLMVVVVDPIRKLIENWKTKKSGRTYPSARPLSQLFQAAPWLVPGVLTLVIIGVFPLVFQAAMSMTDFHSSAIKDGLTGGIWRELWLGLTGQTAPVSAQEAVNSYSRSVHFAGTSLLQGVFGGMLGDILAFEFVWTSFTVTSQLVMGVGLAILLAGKFARLKGFWRTLFILPWAIPEFVAALIWSQIFDPRFGTISLLSATWGQTPGYLQSELVRTWQDLPNQALIILLISALWYGFPIMFMAAAAGMKSISKEVTDAAMLDGANSWQMLRYITLPLLQPFLVPVIILRSIFAFNQFYLFTVMRPPQSLSTLASLSYAVFSYGGQYAVSAAINILTVISLILFIIGFERWSRAGESASHA